MLVFRAGWRWFLLSALLLCPHWASARSPVPVFNRPRTFDVQHYRIAVSFDRASKTIDAATTVTLKPLINGLKSFSLDAEGLDFQAVTDPEGGPLGFSVTPGRVTVELRRAYEAGAVVTVTLKYKARPKKGIYFVGGDGKGDQAARRSQIWTQGEPEEARHWFPAYDFPDDKATTEQLLTVPSDDEVIANGRLISIRPNADGTVTHHFSMELPHSTYLVSFVVGKFKKWEDRYRDVPLGFYVYPERPDLGRKVFSKTADMMRIFEELTAVQYPFNKYDQTIVAEFSFGGMENITATTLSDRDVAMADAPLGATSVEDLVAHELAHSWFGNLVTCRNWAELWLNEGFATFLEAAYREKAYGRSAYLTKIRQDAREYFFDDMTRKRRHGLYNQLARPDDSIFDPIVYKKGGAVLHTLRETVGDEAFWKAVRSYLKRHSFGNAETSDLLREFNEATGQDLSWFFSQWMYGTGHPELKVSSDYSKARKVLTVAVRQVQKTDGLNPRSYRLPVELLIETDGGPKTLKVDIRRSVEVFEFPIPVRPSKISIDPDLKLPLMTVSSNKLTVR